MSGSNARLADLVRIASLLSDQALGPVAGATALLRDSQARVDDITLHRARLAASTDDPVQAALMARHAERLRRLQMSALSDLANARAGVEIAKANARPAFGRHQVLAALFAASGAKT